MSQCFISSVYTFLLSNSSSLKKITLNVSMFQTHSSASGVPTTRSVTTPTASRIAPRATTGGGSACAGHATRWSTSRACTSKTCAFPVSERVLSIWKWYTFWKKPSHFIWPSFWRHLGVQSVKLWPLVLILLFLVLILLFLVLILLFY